MLVVLGPESSWLLPAHRAATSGPAHTNRSHCNVHCPLCAHQVMCNVHSTVRTPSILTAMCALCALHCVHERLCNVCGQFCIFDIVSVAHCNLQNSELFAHFASTANIYKILNMILKTLCLCKSFALFAHLCLDLLKAIKLKHVHTAHYAMQSFSEQW